MKPKSYQAAERELLCQWCDNDYPVWVAPDELWNQVADENEHFLCPTCFAMLAEQRGVVENPIWHLSLAALTAKVKRCEAAISKVAYMLRGGADVEEVLLVLEKTEGK
jgi:hypothetical protein